MLGGGVPLSPNAPPQYVEARCEFAAQVYEKSSNKPKILTLSAGTAHLPQLLSSDGLPVWESTASASYLMKKLNIPPDDVYAETTSYDTISNAFFTRTSFCDVIGWKNLLIITSEFHMMRTKLIFDWIMNVPNKKITGPGEKYELYYLSAPNHKVSADALHVREEKERKSANNVENVLSKNYTTLGDVFDFMTRTHSFYAAEKLVERASKVISSKDRGEMDALRRTYGGRVKENAGNFQIDSSFFSGALFGIVLVVTISFLKSFSNRGGKSHSK